MKEHRAKKEKFLSDSDGLWNVFIHAVSLSTCQDIICVLDAFDECIIGSREYLNRRVLGAFSDQAESMKPKSHTNLKLLMTTSIEKSFLSISKIRLKAENETEAVEKDIEKVIRARVDEIAARKYFSPEVRNELQMCLTGKADRTFPSVSKKSRIV